MILVKLRGGLSNQMFQYAAARRLAAVHNTTVRIDTSWYDNIPSGATLRTYELHKLRITGTRATRWETIGTEGLRRTAPHAVPVALYRKARPRYRFVGERQFHFDPEILDLPDKVCLFGYWMSEKYFSDSAKIIRREFQFGTHASTENEKCAMRIQQMESVAIHVRRGDYVTDANVSAIHGVCDVGYYGRAIEMMRKQLRDPKFFVFSDDLDWAQDNLPLGDDAEFLGHNRGGGSHEDLRLMSLAQHNIIANSSFSWWGAWLNGNDSKLVLAPRRWMNDSSFDTRDVLPRTWIPL